MSDLIDINQVEKRIKQVSTVNKRWTLFPIQHADIWKRCKKQQQRFWVAEEISLFGDLDDWAKLDEGDKYFIKIVLAFFASSDNIVSENLAQRFSVDIDVPEVNYFYAGQTYMEMVHSETYSILIDTYIKDPVEKAEMFSAVENHPAIKAKAEWALKWLNDEEASFLERLLAFGCVEGIFFSASFCAIFWLKKRGKLPGLTFSNELISRDEGDHEKFAGLLYNKIRRGELSPTNVVNIRILSTERVHEIVSSAVECESIFAKSALPENLVGMNAELMIQHIQVCADKLLTIFGYPKLYNVRTPFEWMELISMESKANFFERKVGEYVKTNENHAMDMNDQFALSEDF